MLIPLGAVAQESDEPVTVTPAPEEIEKLEAIEVGEPDEAQEGVDAESDSRVALEVVGVKAEET